ncbi:MAG: DUF11 domain-containing protein, partial [Anaerolineaceae bacterium]|nr:DUF11 domain-containing protein [Anaerolineaceae bacterium]
MRAKNVVPLVIFVFVLSGFLVNSVFAMPTDPQKEFVRDESKFESKLSSVQEDLEPVEYSTHSIYYEENDRTLDLLDDFVPPPQVDNSRDSSFTSHNSFELSSAAVDLLENTVQGSSPWQQLNEDGFGGTNYLIPAVQEFNGYLYAGTWKSDGYGSAEVWRTDDGSSWQLVDERPRNGCADLVVFGTYLYCGDWNGVIWRTSDGEIWEEVITDGFGDASNGIARFAVFDGKLYAGTWNGASAQIWRTNNGTDWTIFGNGLDPDNIVGGAISTEIFGGYLYWGTGNWETGAQLWRTDGTLLEQMTTGTSPAISSLAAFDGYLYAGVWDATSTQVWRSADGSGWTHMLTFSDLGSGIREENGLEVYDGMLYLVGANPDTGLEVWRTGNGTNWEQVGFAGFGDTSNERSYWDNAITTFGGKLIISTNNYNTGGEVWAYAPNDYEVYDVGMWLNLGVNDWLWGNAIPGSNVTIETPRETINSYADPGCNGCWGIDVPIELNPGDTITITAEPGSYPVDFTIPTPLVSIADSSTDTVSGEIGGWNSQTVTIHSGWDNGDQEVTTDASGNFSATYTDIPRGGEGYIHFATVDDGADINYHQYFRTPDLIMEIRTDYDQIEGQYAPGHSIVLTVKDGDDNIKAHTTIETTEIEEWGGQTGFATWMDGVSWMPSPPDIVSGDKIYGSVDGGNYETYSQVGDITGVVNVDTDSISGTINAPWLIPDPGLVDVECYAWGAPDGAPDKHSSVIPDGNPANTYTCFWDPFTEWDVEVNQWIGVAYRDPQSNKIIEEFYEPDYNLYLNVNYDHDWIEGSYPSGYDVTLWVTDSEGDEKARTTITTGHLPWLGTGFSTTTEGVVWDPEQPDIHPGDWVYGQVTVGDTTYNVQVRLGTISGTLEAESDSFTGYVSVPWLPQDMEVPVQVHPWGAPEGTSSCESSVLPNGTDPFTCDWTTEWDVQPGQQIAALYMDPAEHWVYSVHTAYTDELILQVHYDHEWISGSYEAGHDIHLQVLDESLIEKAHIDLISGYVYGWGSTTGFYTNMEGAHWVPGWPDMQPGDTIHGEVDGGLEFTTDVKIGTITGDLDLTNEQISGTVDVPWRLPEPIDIGCYIWENDSPGNKYVNADPVADVYPYSCSWDGEYDIQPDTDVMVAYFELAGHEVIGDFSYPSSRLQIDKWLESGDPGVGGNVTFNIQYFNDGKGTAVNTNITDTFGEGLTYISDTSGITPSVDGDTVTWALNDLAPGGDRVNFYVFAQVTAAEGATITNTATISSDT